MQKFIMKKAVVTFLFIFLATCVFAGTHPDHVMFVSGNVSDKSTHETLAGVEVRVSGTDIVVYTDFDGNFFLPAIPIGSYQLQFNYVTYSATQVVTDNCDHCSELSVELTQR
ncbi:MAG TPA: carboxypeptidase-like regulatory domain-containing protein [Bacteroidia bacterium]|jgi:hypothetical protein|nr:carboxypeptidase-like regulatory domain-containing protein [Bacteroidia bacterium]